MPISPTVEGFRAAFRRPLLTFAEITWRWVVGTTATVLFFFGLFEYLDTLPVTNGELLFLRTRNPFLVSQALAHILRGSLVRGVFSLMLAALLLSVVWMVAASVGRFVTVDAMTEYFREQFRECGALDREPATGGVLHQDRTITLLRLNFLRVAVVLAGLIGLAGAVVLVGFISTPAHPRPALAFLLLLLITAVLWLIVYELNWLLSLAAVFIVRDGDDAVAAISSAVALCRERSSAVFAVSTWTGTVHLIVFAGASTVASIPLALAQLLPWRLSALGVVVVTLAYFAVADWIYTARLAGYVCIAEMPDALPAPILGPSVPPQIEPSVTIDRDELILSDVPLPSGI